MLKLRLIYGLLFGGLLLTMFYFDQTLSAGWPGRTMSFPPGTLMVLSLIGMGFAAAGYLTPVAGALLQEGIDILAILNALRLIWKKTIDVDYNGGM